MLAIGRALMCDPRLLLLDEPSLGIAPLIVRSIGQALRRINEQGVGILLAEQSMTLALSVASHGYLIESGAIKISGSDRSSPLADDEVRVHLLGGDSHMSSPPGLVPAPRRHRRSLRCLKVSELSLRFGAVAALDEVTFAVRPGELFAVIGPNGAGGKTSLFNVLTCIYPPSSGTLRCFGADLSGRRPHQLPHGDRPNFPEPWTVPVDVRHRQRPRRPYPPDALGRGECRASTPWSRA